jgi:hypothetical protein
MTEAEATELLAMLATKTATKTDMKDIAKIPPRPRGGRGYTEEEKKRILEVYDMMRGYNPPAPKQDICKVLGVSHVTLRSFVRERDAEKKFEEDIAMTLGISLDTLRTLVREHKPKPTSGKDEGPDLEGHVTKLEKEMISLRTELMNLRNEVVALRATHVRNTRPQGGYRPIEGKTLYRGGE